MLFFFVQQISLLFLFFLSQISLLFRRFNLGNGFYLLFCLFVQFYLLFLIFLFSSLFSRNILSFRSWISLGLKWSWTHPIEKPNSMLVTVVGSYDYARITNRVWKKKWITIERDKHLLLTPKKKRDKQVWIIFLNTYKKY